MALSERLLGPDGEQTIVSNDIKKIIFSGGDKVLCNKIGFVGHIVQGCCGGLKEDEKLVNIGFIDELGRESHIVVNVGDLVLLKKGW